MNFNILIKNLAFEKGKWVGLFDFTFTINNETHTGKVSFVYERTWLFYSFKTPNLFTEQERENISKEFYNSFEKIKPNIEKNIFKVREEFAEKPIIVDFLIDEHKTTQEEIFATFRLKNIQDQFYIKIQLIDSQWNYKIKSYRKMLNSYKTFYTWEDFVFEKVNEEINKESKLRIRYNLHTKKYKFK